MEREAVDLVHGVAYSELSQVKRSTWGLFQTSCTVSNGGISPEKRE